ncbi:hypothetical protein L227DRAFT_598096, partial [Lentinus tigrinus ALCF2SS1-6]
MTGKEGKLARDAAGQEVVQADLVVGGRYYYIVDDGWTVDYGIFYSFDAWVPPQREQVPDRWFTDVYPRSRPPSPTQYVWEDVSGRSVNTLREKARDQDGACRLSGFEDPTEAVHIVPEAYRSWYYIRQIYIQLCDSRPMPRTLAGVDTIHDIRNYITLRTDLHKRWDAHAFVFIPV